MIVLAAILVLFLSVYLVAFMRRRTRELASSAKIVDGFYHSADALIDDERTPEIIVEQISRISSRLNEKYLLLWFVIHVLLGKTREVVKSERYQKLDHAVKELPDELLGHYFRAVTASLFIATYQSAFLGPLFRRLILFGLEVSERSREQEQDLRSEKFAVGVFGRNNCKGNHHHDDGSMAAAA